MSLEFVGAGAVDGQEPVVEVRHLDESVGGLHHVGQHLAFFQRGGDRRLKPLVEPLQPVGLFTQLAAQQGSGR